MGIVKAVQLRCRVTVSHNHPVNFVNEIHKMLDNFVISNPFCLIFFGSDATLNNLPSLKVFSMFKENKMGVLILNGCGLNYSDFQILATKSSNK